MYAMYLRKSRDDLEADTLERHERILKKYAARNNIIIEEEYIFREVVSGDSIDERPAMLSLLNLVNTGQVDGVLCVELERLTRGKQGDQDKIAIIFQINDTKILTLNKVYDPNNEYDEDFFEIGLFMSRREYKAINRRLLRGRLESQEEGYFIGSVLPYGFTKERQGKGFILVENKTEADIVRYIFNQYAMHGSLSLIMHYLNNNNIKPRTATLWNCYLIRNILINKVYIGKINKNRTIKNTKLIDGKIITTKNKNRVPEFVEGKHKPLIDMELWNKCQFNLKMKSHKVNLNRELRNPFASLMYCSVCGKILRYCNTKRKNNNYDILEYLKCSTARCDSAGTRLELLEVGVINELKKELKGYYYYIANYDKEMELNNKKINLDIGLLKKELVKRTNMLDRACELLEEGIYTKDKYLKRVAALNGDIEAIKSNIKKLNNQTDDKNVRIKKMIPILEECLSSYDELSVKEKNVFLKSFIDRIIYTRPNLKSEPVLKVLLKI